MTIPETVYNECDCCGYGFEVFPNFDSRIFTTRGALIEYRNKSDLAVTGGVNRFTLGIPTKYWLPEAGFTGGNLFHAFSEETSSLGGVELGVTNSNGVLTYDIDPGIVVVGPGGGENYFSNDPSNHYIGPFRYWWESVARKHTVISLSFADLIGATNRYKVQADTKKFDSRGNLVWEVREPYPVGMGTPSLSVSYWGFATRGVIGFKDGSIHTYGMGTFTGNQGPGFVGGPIHYRYDVNGNKVWEKVEIDSSPSHDPIYAVFLENGNLVLACTGNSIITVFSPDGTVLLQSTSLNGDTGAIFKMVSHGNSVFMLRTYGGLSKLQKYSGDTLQTLDWTVSATRTANAQGYVTNPMAVDQEGNVYLCEGTSIKKYNGDDGTLLASQTAATTLDGIGIPPGPPPNYHYNTLL